MIWNSNDPSIFLKMSFDQSIWYDWWQLAFQLYLEGNELLINWRFWRQWVADKTHCYSHANASWFKYLKNEIFTATVVVMCKHRRRNHSNAAVDPSYNVPLKLFTIRSIFYSISAISRTTSSFTKNTQKGAAKVLYISSMHHSFSIYNQWQLQHVARDISMLVMVLFTFL